MKEAVRQVPVTCLLVGLCVLMYLVEILSGGATNSQTLLNLGANFAPLLRAGEWWRVFTAAFLHIGITHLLLNVLVLYYLGRTVEGLTGHFRMAIIYLVSVVMGNLASAAIQPETISAGASTGIFGLFGAFVFLGSEFRQYAPLRVMARQYLILVGINLAFDLMTPGIDIYGHLGGLAGGFLVMALVGCPQLGPINLRKRILSGAVLVLGLLLLGKVVFFQE
ncbi:MAG: rhomboid family intramembrane serine protease [Limosilactobacillus gorillae]|uniref:rhomboid family intramembrane serine protease n=1 Tax=Limosilactobacillus gorillae TaxID=1450649 RepID=UPI000AC3A6C1|nr:rhomboid family intramembrane serine protease [Limosilactobacillus gorillae]MDO4855485.1 rhomboid family intramembrane serine protease [Limosilactobacillus gorillae]